MDNSIRVGAVSYLNTKPLLYGIRRSEWMNRMVLLEDYPARIAGMLMEGSIDVGLVPVAIIPRLKEAHIITDYCIGADGDVASVAIFSEVPMEQITTVLLDYQSRTSVNLARILLNKFWKKEVQLNEAGEDFRSRIRGTTAGVVIGDRALEQRSISAYTYDLAGAWKSYTGLPFVFAAWVANKPLPAGFLGAFNSANETGLSHLQEVADENPYPHYDLATYYTKNISFTWDAAKQQGMSRFLEELTMLDN